MVAMPDDISALLFVAMLPVVDTTATRTTSQIEPLARHNAKADAGGQANPSSAKDRASETKIRPRLEMRCGRWNRSYQPAAGDHFLQSVTPTSPPQSAPAEYVCCAGAGDQRSLHARHPAP